MLTSAQEPTQQYYANQGKTKANQYIKTQGEKHRNVRQVFISHFYQFVNAYTFIFNDRNSSLEVPNSLLWESLIKRR